MTPASERHAGLSAAIDALRARGAPRVDPVRFRRIEAMARRAERHDGPARQLIDGMLDRLLAACAEAVERAGLPSAAVAAMPAPTRSALAELLADIDRGAAKPGAAAGSAPTQAPAPPELRSIRDHRGTWARLSIDRRMSQSRATVPGNAGPLHTQRLLHQALTLMRDASPEYLQRFMSHIEALLALEQAHLASPAAKKEPARGPRGGVSPRPPKKS